MSPPRVLDFARLARLAGLAALMNGLVNVLPASAAALLAPQQVRWASTFMLPGDATDLSGKPTGANGNRLGGLGSSIFYDPVEEMLYALADRGAGGGVYSFESRFHTFEMDIDRNTGRLRRLPRIKSTVFFTHDSIPFDGTSPHRLAGGGTTVGSSFDPEGLVVLSTGNLLVSDEYGPNVYEFNPQGQFVKALGVPPNLVPHLLNFTAWFADDNTAIKTGRQANRGYEGLAVDPSETYAYAVLQDPLQDEGTSTDKNPGRLSRNVRIVRYSLATGLSDAQYVYQLESLEDINARLAALNTTLFKNNQQGRSIGLSEIFCLTPTTFLVLERDNRGLGVEDQVQAGPKIGSKRVYLIDISNATDVSGTSLVNYTTTLPPGVVPVAKTLLLDIDAELRRVGVTVVEKYEGLGLGPQLANGDFSLLLVNDNDFSTTQNESTLVQYDVYTNAATKYETPVIDTAPNDTSLKLLATYFSTFRIPQALIKVTPRVWFERSAIDVCFKKEDHVKVVLKRSGTLDKLDATISVTTSATTATQGTWRVSPSTLKAAFKKGQQRAEVTLDVRYSKPDEGNEGNNRRAPQPQATVELTLSAEAQGGLNVVLEPARRATLLNLRAGCGEEDDD